MSSRMAEHLSEVDALGREGALRARTAVEDHWRDMAVWVIAWSAFSAALYMIVRMIVRRRRKTFWQRALARLEAMGRRTEHIVKRIGKLAEENIDPDKLADQVGGRIRNIEAELRSVEHTIATAASRGKKLAKRIRG
jgi:hypothetical protein